MPLPSDKEETEIVRRIEAAFAPIERIAGQTKRALALLGRLEHAALAQTFRGELVGRAGLEELE